MRFNQRIRTIENKAACIGQSRAIVLDISDYTNTGQFKQAIQDHIAQGFHVIADDLADPKIMQEGDI